VQEGRVRALLTAIAMPAGRGGAALGDRPEHDGFEDEEPLSI
jgi:hypothetical protein